MVVRLSIRRMALMVMAATLATSTMAGGAAAHIGESGHIHAPGDSSVHTSSVWCVQFTQDPGAWRPDGVTAVDYSLLDGVSIVFVDCADLLDGHYSIESFTGGSLSLTEVNEPIIGQSDGSSTGNDRAGPAVASFITADKWARHQKQWLAKGDRLLAKLSRVKTVLQIRQALGAMQKHMKAETQWLRSSKERFEPGSCLAADMQRWKKHVGQAQQSLNKMVSAANKGNIAAARSNGRQYARHVTKLEQVYNTAVCDF